MLAPRVFLSLAIAGLVAGTSSAQTIQAPYNSAYSYRSLGTVPGVPLSYGGVTFKYDDPDVLLIGGDANRAAGAVYAIRVTRDPAGSITGFQGTATLHSTAPDIDGGLQYGPNNVLFFTRYSSNAIGQIKTGSSIPDKDISLPTVPGWVGNSPGALSFVPPGFPGAGSLKICSYSGGSFHSCIVTPDGTGTFDLTGMQLRATLTGSPEGLLYPPPGSPLIPDYARIMIVEYGAGSIAIYDLDASGDPVPATRVVFLNGLSGAEGATIDPRTGSFVFSTYGGGGQVAVVDGFGACGTFVNYGSGIPGAGGRTPSIRGIGCARTGQAIAYQVGNGPPGAIGALNIGFQQWSIPLFGGFVLTEPSIPIGHALDPLGAWQVTLNTPASPALIGNHVYFQGVYIDTGAPFGLTASDGLDMVIF